MKQVSRCSGKLTISIWNLLQDSKFLALIAAEIARFHNVTDIPDQKDAWIFDDLRKLVTIISNRSSVIVSGDSSADFDRTLAESDPIESVLNSPIHCDGSSSARRISLKGLPSVKQLFEEIEWLEKSMIECGSPIVFCHNDLSRGKLRCLL